MGKENNFIKAVILSDDTIIQNMQCELNAKIPSDKDLNEIDTYNLKYKKEMKNVYLLQN